MLSFQYEMSIKSLCVLSFTQSLSIMWLFGIMLVIQETLKDSSEDHMVMSSVLGLAFLAERRRFGGITFLFGNKVGRVFYVNNKK